MTVITMRGRPAPATLVIFVLLPAGGGLIASLPACYMDINYFKVLVNSQASSSILKYWPFRIILQNVFAL